ncbi:hypothetical protein CK203_065127 [Vitis vinifera]|uniref:Uncharacterized protein n=1 Tax=Vitis vinifera TaxID=29760 RepID=A0A438G488_VITVI|nr:hypothetical protein CK203_116121 [Vitis vinifera]RVW66996.1 hypothetical protein CK203_065127 [Vitis vinifera]
MESGLSSLGSSLLVPCVQELVKEPLTAVPHRYLRPEQDPPVLSNTTDSMPHVPIIDLHHACQEWGFFQGYHDEQVGEKTENGRCYQVDDPYFGC